MATETDRIRLIFEALGVKGVTGGLTSIGAASNALRGALLRLAPALVGVLSVRGLARVAKSAIDSADAMTKAAQGAGVTVAEYSALSHAATLAGIDQEKLALGLSKLTVQMAKTGRGGQSVAEELLAVSDQFAALPDGAAKSDLAIRIFGERMGRQMIPLLNQGSEAIRQQIKEAQTFGVVIGERFSANAERFNDNLTRIRAAFHGLVIQLVDRLLPGLIALQERFLAWAVDTQAHIVIVETLVELYRDWLKIIASVEFGFRGLAAFIGTFAGNLSETKNPLEAWREAVNASNQEMLDFEAKLRGIAEAGNLAGDAFWSAASGLTSFLSREEELGALIAQDELRLRFTNASLISANEARAERVRILGEELARVRELIALRQAEAGLEAGGLTKEGAAASAELLQLEARSAQIQSDIARAGGGGIITQLRLEMRELGDQIGSTAQIIARNFRTVIGGAIDAIAGGIEGLINGTLTWGQALRQVGSQILSGVVSAISRMFAEWIVGRLAVKAVEISAAGAEAVAKAPGALLTSISSYGAAAVVGLAALIAAIAALSGAFQTGGFTGGGDPNQPAGIVHRREFVFDQPAVDRLGVSNLEALRSGGGISVGGAGQGFNVAIFDDRSRLREWMQSREGQAVILDVVGKNKHRFS